MLLTDFLRLCLAGRHFGKRCGVGALGLTLENSIDDGPALLGGGIVPANRISDANRGINGNHRHRHPGTRVPREAAKGFAPERRLARPEEDKHGDTNQRHRREVVEQMQQGWAHGLVNPHTRVDDGIGDISHDQPKDIEEGAEKDHRAYD